jgi:MFS family permease
MAEMGWTAQVAAAAGIAAGTGAAQLGLGYGLGVVEWPAVPADDSVWLGSLGWATWIAASSTVFGAVIAGRLGRAVNGPWRFALAVSAAVGGLLTVALIALPARAAVRTDTFAPQTIAGGYAVIGVLLGLLIAYWAVVSRPVAANLIATAAWLWSLAVAAVLTTIFWHRPSATYLSSWQFFSPDTADGQYGIIFWPSALLTLLAAFAVGIIGVLPATRRGDLGVGAAASGAVGPLLVAAAFLVLAPQLTGTPGPLQSAYLIAPYAVLAGLAGSALVVALGQRRTADHPIGDRTDSDRAVEGRAVAGRAVAGRAVAGRAVEGRAGESRPGEGRTDESRAGEGRASEGTGAGAASARAAAAGSVSARTPRSRPARPDTRERPEATSGRTAQPNTDKTASARPASSGESAGAVRSKRAGAASGQPASRENTVAEPATAVVPSARPEAGTEPGPRKSFMDRFRRKGAGEDDAPATATGRAKAPASAISSAPAGSGAEARGKSPSVDGGARPAASSAPGRSDSRSTVAPPPTSPPIAKINDPQSGEKPPAPRKAASRPSSNTTPGPADAVGSDKTPAARKTPAKSTKTPTTRPPTSPSAPAKSTAPKPAKATDDTAELPVQDAKQREDRP